MGKKKDKKKGHGQEKTLQKANKKAAKSLKKELGGSAGDDVEDIIAELEKKEQAATAVSIESCDPPGPRSHATLTAHPSKDELLLFGGEFDNGQTTAVFNELYVYNIAKNEWRRVSSPNSPLPRSSHQAVALEMNNEAQLWLFGGEFTSPNQSQFYHYNDVWCLHLSNMTWEKVAVKGGPSARSGHRMIVHKRKLVIFGGFYDNGQVVRYFNDLHVFDLDTRTWLKIGAAAQSASASLAPIVKRKDAADSTVVETAPGPRSGFHFFVNEEKNCAVVYGGYRKEKVKGEVERSTTLQDMWALDLTAFTWTMLRKQPPAPKPAPSAKNQKPAGAKGKGGKGDKADKAAEAKDKVLAKPQVTVVTGPALASAGPSVRSGASMCVIPKKRCVLFGGAVDEESDEDMQTVCLDDMYMLRLDTMKWYPWSMRKPKAKGAVAATTAAAAASAGAASEEKAKVDAHDSDAEFDSADEEDVVDPAAPASDSAPSNAAASSQAHRAAAKEDLSFMPSPRYRALLAVKGSILYLWGGIAEQGAAAGATRARGHEVAMNDMYALDTVKADGWRVLVRFDPTDARWQWLGSDDEKSDDDDNNDDDDDDEDSEDEDDDASDDSDESDDADAGSDNDAPAADPTPKPKASVKAASSGVSNSKEKDKAAAKESIKPAASPSKPAAKPSKGSGADNSTADPLAPKAGEAYKEYYERTRALWDERAAVELKEQEQREELEYKDQQAAAPADVDDDDAGSDDVSDDDDSGVAGAKAGAAKGKGKDKPKAKGGKGKPEETQRLSQMSASEKAKALRKVSAQIAAQHWQQASR
jgi:N-acetylneuraminic acid mutarotase